MSLITTGALPLMWKPRPVFVGMRVQYCDATFPTSRCRGGGVAWEEPGEGRSSAKDSVKAFMVT